VVQEWPRGMNNSNWFMWMIRWGILFWKTVHWTCKTPRWRSWDRAKNWKRDYWVPWLHAGNCGGWLHVNDGFWGEAKYLSQKCGFSNDNNHCKKVLKKDSKWKRIRNRYIVGHSSSFIAIRAEKEVPRSPNQAGQHGGVAFRPAI
jgi:hypothetical protein